MEKILLVEDEKEISDLIAFYLRNENFSVITCADGNEAQVQIEQNSFSLAILDVMLPDITGFDLCKIIRKKHHYPIIMLTAKSEEIDKITGLTIGADDYITKPFRPLEVIARVKAQIRRSTQYNGSDQNKLIVRELELDVNKRKCLLQEEELSLTPIEFSILKLLMERKGQVVSSEEMFQEVWAKNITRLPIIPSWSTFETFGKKCTIPTRSPLISKPFGGSAIKFNTKNRPFIVRKGRFSWD